MLGAIFQLHEFERLHGVVAASFGANAAVDHRQFDILQHVEFWKQIEELKHETDFFIADAREFSRRGVFDASSIQRNGSLRGRIQATKNVHKSGFAAAGGSDDGNEFACLDI